MAESKTKKVKYLKIKDVDDEEKTIKCDAWTAHAAQWGTEMGTVFGNLKKNTFPYCQVQASYPAQYTFWASVFPQMTGVSMFYMQDPGQSQYGVWLFDANYPMNPKMTKKQNAKTATPGFKPKAWTYDQVTFDAELNPQTKADSPANDNAVMADLWNFKGTSAEVSEWGKKKFDLIGNVYKVKRVESSSKGDLVIGADGNDEAVILVKCAGGMLGFNSAGSTYKGDRPGNMSFNAFWSDFLQFLPKLVDAEMIAFTDGDFMQL